MSRNDDPSGESVHVVRPKRKLRFWQDAEQKVAVDGISDDEEECGERAVAKVQDPAEPSAEERRAHSMTHLPFRSWCRHCVRGRGKEEPCRKIEDAQVGPEVHLDFMFRGEETGGKTLTIVVARERSSKAVMASVAPKKSSGEFIARRVVAFMKELGCDKGQVTVKSDNEPAIQAVVEKFGSVRAAGGGGRMVVESSPVGSSKSNGII